MLHQIHTLFKSLVGARNQFFYFFHSTSFVYNQIETDTALNGFLFSFKYHIGTLINRNLDELINTPKRLKYFEIKTLSCYTVNILNVVSLIFRK